MKTIVVALRATVLTFVLCGLIYPLFATGLAQVIFPARASGSLVHDARGNVVGSDLIGQPFVDPRNFQPRPGAYDAMASGGSNLGVTSAKLRDRAAADVARLRRQNPDAAGPVPVELAAASASGLDPHISPQAALWQVPRVARARGVAPERVRALVLAAVEGRDLGFLGEPRINVLRLNLTLDRVTLGQ